MSKVKKIFWNISNEYDLVLYTIKFYYKFKVIGNI